MKPFERLLQSTTDDDKIKVLQQIYMMGFKKGQQWPELEGIGLIQEMNAAFEEEILP